MNYTKMNSLIRLVFTFCLISFLFGISNLTAQVKKIPKEDIPAIKKAYELEREKGDSQVALDQLLNLRKAYSHNFMFDSIESISGEINELALAVENYNEYIGNTVKWLSFQAVMKKEIIDHEQKMKNLIDFFDKPGVTNINKSILLHQTAIYYREHNLIDSAEVYVSRSLIYADLADEKELISSIHRVLWSELLIDQGKYNDAINVLLEAEVRSKKASKKEIAQIRIYDSLGKVFQSINDFEKSEFYYRKSMKISKEQNYERFYSVTQLFLGQALIKAGSIDEGRTYLDISTSALIKKKGYRLIPDAYTYQAFGYLQQNDLVNTKKYIDSTYYYKKFSSRESFILLHYNTEIEYNLRTGQFAKAKKLLDLISNRTDKDDYSGTIDLLWSKYYKAIGDEEKALTYYEIHVSKRDEVITRNRIIQTQRLESEFNREKQDLEISSLNTTKVAQEKALAVRNTALLFGSIMLLILLGLLYGLYRLYKRNKENQVVLAEQNLKISEALSDNKVLMKEIHHRVKNNLQVISSLLNMQARKVTDEGTKEALNTSKTRVQSMSILHQKLYNKDNLKNVDINEYIKDLVDNIIATYHTTDDIKINIDVDKLSLDVDTLVPLGLITNELICNALKHAFVGKDKGVLDVKIRESENEVTLIVEDDGVGLPTNELPTKEGSLGVRLINSFANKMNGRIEVDSNNGTSIKVIFKKENLSI